MRPWYFDILNDFRLIGTFFPVSSLAKKYPNKPEFTMIFTVYGTVKYFEVVHDSVKLHVHYFSIQCTFLIPWHFILRSKKI